MYFDKNYENYLRNVLDIDNADNAYNANRNIQNVKIKLEDFYPEIYKIIYPMITKKCSLIKEPLTKEFLEDITDEIYETLEPQNNEINLNININNKAITEENRNGNVNEKESRKDCIRETRGVSKSPQNNNLRDLIKILLIRELIGRLSYPSPIFPRPPIFPVRPPLRPRGYEEYLYEKF